jgi:hypothetical protein
LSCIVVVGVLKFNLIMQNTVCSILYNGIMIFVESVDISTFSISLMTCAGFPSLMKVGMCNEKSLSFSLGVVSIIDY